MDRCSAISRPRRTVSGAADGFWFSAVFQNKLRPGRHLGRDAAADYRRHTASTHRREFHGCPQSIAMAREPANRLRTTDLFDYASRSVDAGGRKASAALL